MPLSGPDLAVTLLGGFRALVDAAVAELARRGHEDVRPVHDYAMRAILAGADTASDLGRSLSVTKQSAARTITVLTQRGYVTSGPDPRDTRRKRLQLTDLGHEVLRTGEEIFDALRTDWAHRLGEERFAEFEQSLVALVGVHPVRFDSPGWMAGLHGAAPAGREM